MSIVTGSENIDLDEVAAELRDHAETNRTEIFGNIMKDSNVEQFLSKVPNARGIYKMTKKQIDKVLQPFQTTFTPQGEVKFTPSTIIMRRAKADLTFTVEELYDSYLSALYNKEGADIKDLTIVKVIMELIGEKAMEERGIIAMNGVYQAPVPGTAGDPLDTCDGLLTILDELETAANGINIIAAGDISTNPFDTTLAFIRAMKKAELRACGNVIFTSTEIVDSVADDWQANNSFKDVKWVDNGYGIVIPNTGGVVLQGLENAEDSTRLWATPKNNRMKLFDQFENIGKPKFQVFDRQLKILMDMALAYGFGFEELIYTNETL